MCGCMVAGHGIYENIRRLERRRDAPHAGGGGGEIRRRGVRSLHLCSTDTRDPCKNGSKDAVDRNPPGCEFYMTQTGRRQDGGASDTRSNDRYIRHRAGASAPVFDQNRLRYL